MKFATEKILLVALCLSVSVGLGADVSFNAKTRGLEFSGSEGGAWLVDGVSKVYITEGPTIATSDERFEVTVVEHADRKVLRGVDSQGVLDWEMVVRVLDPRSLRIDWTIFNRSDKPLTLDRIDAVVGKLTGEIVDGQDRVLTNGMNSWSGADIQRHGEKAKIESYCTLAVQTPPLAAGFLAGRHNLDRFTLTRDDAGLIITAYGNCDKCILPAGGSRSIDPLYVCGEGNPLKQMERFADLAAEENGVELWPENFATWCSWYAGWIRQEPLHDYKGGLQKGVEANIPWVASRLGKRGEPSMRIVDDSNEMAYGDWNNKTLAIPGGFDRLAEKMKQQGIRPGVWYPAFWVPTKSRLYQERPQLLVRGEDGKPHVNPRPFYGNYLSFLDASNPEAAAQMEQTARAWRDRGFRYVMTDFMIWGVWTKGPRFDPTLTAVEAYNRGVDAMRRGFGKDTYWLHCGALLGPAMGRCDGMRIGGDSHGGAIYAYEASGQRWFYNWRVWLNDPDAIVCFRRGEAKTVDWNRTWMSWMAISGNVLTYGDTLDDLPEEYLELYKRVLPPLAVAGRPLDLWENDPYLLWGMAPGEADGPVTLFGVFEFQGKRVGQKITLNLDEVAARSRDWEAKPDEAPATWLLWDFWKHKLTKVDGAKLTIDVPEKTGHVFALRADLGRPQLLGTSGHISQGVLETKDIVWHERSHSIRGRVRGNGGDPTTLFFHVPDGVTCTDAYVDYVRIKPEMIEANVAAVHVQKIDEAPVPLEVRFRGPTKEPQSRPFESGPVGKVTGE